MFKVYFIKCALFVNVFDYPNALLVHPVLLIMISIKCFDMFVYIP